MKKSEDNMRVLKTATCKSVTGKSTLTYQLGQALNHTVHIRITKNSSSGQFSSEWVKIDDIQRALAGGREGEPLTSFMLQNLFKGKSVNTPAFIMAALTKEQLLCTLKGKKRGHEWDDRDGFELKLEKLTSGKTTKKAVTRKAPRKKATVRKKTATRKKTAKTG